MKNSSRMVVWVIYLKGMGLEQRATISLTHDPPSANVTTFMKPIVINSRQAGRKDRTDQENG